LIIYYASGNLEVDVHGMSGEKDNWSRADKLNNWFREGGVLIIGYDMFRNLTNEKNKKFKAKQRNVFNQ
jgi:transcriptional regulator ATRX